jgi:hypothetical protein
LFCFTATGMLCIMTFVYAAVFYALTSMLCIYCRPTISYITFTMEEVSIRNHTWSSLLLTPFYNLDVMVIGLFFSSEPDLVGGNLKKKRWRH